jgi:hypothetical protein
MVDHEYTACEAGKRELVSHTRTLACLAGVMLRARRSSTVALQCSLMHHYFHVYIPVAERLLCLLSGSHSCVHQVNIKIIPTTSRRSSLLQRITSATSNSPDQRNVQWWNGTPGASGTSSTLRYILNQLWFIFLFVLFSSFNMNTCTCYVSLTIWKYCWIIFIVLELKCARNCLSF